MLALPRPGLGAPIEISADRASAPPRQDPGHGICATTVHIDSDGVLTSTAEAIVRLGLDVGQGNIDGKVRGRFAAVNFRNAQPGAEGDFTGAGSDESYLPFSNHPTAMPQGNDKNIATRVRGYLNVLRPGTVTMAVHAEAGFRLTIGDILVLRSAANMSGRFTQQVRFVRQGMYRLELVHYVAAGPRAILELAVADGAQPELSGDANPLGSAYRLVPQARLYTALAGQSDCRECTTDAACGAGQHCGDHQLCQPCQTSQRCGPTCMPCPATAPACKVDTCVECTPQHNELCTARGLVCHNNNTCGPCQTSAQCDGLVCRSDGTCGPCTQDAECGPGQVCDRGAGGRCSMPQCTAENQSACTAQGLVCDVERGRCRSCTADADCQALDRTLQCDGNAGRCVPRRDLRYLGGCSLAGRAEALGVLGPVALCLLVLTLHAARGSGRRGRWQPVVRPRPSRRRPRHGGLLAGLLLLVALPARANLSLNAQTFRPALGPENIITVEGTRTPALLAPTANLVVDFAFRPLRLYDQDFGAVVAHPVGTMTTAHVQVGLGVTRFLLVGASLPVVAYQTFDDHTTLVDPRAAAPQPVGVGDLRVVAKLRILDNLKEGGGFGLALVPQVSFPTGVGQQFRGDDAFGIEPRIALDYRLRHGLFVALNVGFWARTSDQVIQDNRTTDERSVVRISHQVRYGLGLYAPIVHGLGLGGEVVGGTSILPADDGTLYSALEGLATARYVHQSGLGVSVGGGGPFVSAPGIPQFRVFASVGYMPLKRPGRRVSREPTNPDPDGDGLLVPEDRCPNEAGPKENGGCPDRDGDGDGLVDRLDACPEQSGVAEANGCPDVDSDGDGVVDRLDRCPDRAGPADQAGCPPENPDGDGDGVPDREDKCPSQPGVADNAGCPDPDADGDTLVDRLDRCPQQPGPKEAQGCPLVQLGDAGVKLALPLRFVPGQPNLDPASTQIVQALARLLGEQGSIQKLQVVVPASGDPKTAKKLADKRAKVLAGLLVEAGVARKRLQIRAARGVGGDEVTEVTVVRGKAAAKDRGTRRAKSK
ncbi:MAG: thrombospondin type 3 repeat-containing protein [Myxococcales bacterium]|nr:thrombospondin type 3 repeat-containing protein [Myxococcota bacterium]MDW8284186.1 thrombospondin type 3 repeat-containing protein [Myxococcales bacterium]